MSIEAMIFDLDGTLVQTEKLKAISYARAVSDLSESEIEQKAVIAFYKEVVGKPRQEVGQALLTHFNLADTAMKRMAEFGVNTPWQAFVQLRLKYYERMIANSQVIVENQWPNNLELLAQARTAGCKTGLATMSTCEQANRVLEILNLKESFDFIATRDDVEVGKPDPEIYTLVSRELGIRPSRCLVIEDSPAGVRSALAAKMHCIAVTTPFTRERIQTLGLLENWCIVHKPDEVSQVVQRKLDELRD